MNAHCVLPTADQGGLRPTVWEGYEYTEAEFVSKAYGESANNQQSEFCDLCCRDHHDGGSGEEDVGSDPGRVRYNPFRSSGDTIEGRCTAITSTTTATRWQPGAG